MCNGSGRLLTGVDAWDVLGSHLLSGIAAPATRCLARLGGKRIFVPARLEDFALCDGDAVLVRIVF